jgi:mono/diheme cytochrome c family protein
MRNFIKVVLFVAAFLSLFAFIANQIPQQASLPPTVEKFDPSQIKSKDDLVKIGQKIFYDKGQCALCHSIGHSATARCPNLQGVGGKLTREFIYESVTQPQAYTYMDYTYSPPKFFPARMPVINKPPIDLNNNELLSVMSFIQSQGGEVTIDPSEIVLSDSGAALGRAGDPVTGQKVFAKMACAKCHAADQLQAKLSNKDEGMIRQAILDPNAGVKTDPKPVHKGFDQALSVRDFNDLTAYLAGFKTAAVKP